MSSSKVREEILLAAAVLFPFILRSIVDSAISWARSCCNQQCCGNRNTTDLVLGTGVKSLSLLTIMLKEPDDQDPMLVNGEDESNFSKAVDFEGGIIAMKLPRGSVIGLAISRLLFWHLMQPILYYTVFYAYWPLLDSYQKVFGTIVGIREFYYAIICLIGVKYKPVYLIPDLKASLKRSEFRAILIYVVAPEKYVTAVILGKLWKRADRVAAVMALLLCMDLFSLCAMLTAYAAHRVHIPMMIGYCITAVSSVLFFSFFVLEILVVYVKHCCGMAVQLILFE